MAASHPYNGWTERIAILFADPDCIFQGVDMICARHQPFLGLLRQIDLPRVHRTTSWIAKRCRFSGRNCTLKYPEETLSPRACTTNAASQHKGSCGVRSRTAGAKLVWVTAANLRLDFFFREINCPSTIHAERTTNGMTPSHLSVRGTSKETQAHTCNGHSPPSFHHRSTRESFRLAQS